MAMRLYWLGLGEALLDAVAQAVLGFVVDARLLATARRDDRLGPLDLNRFDQSTAVMAVVDQHMVRSESRE